MIDQWLKDFKDSWMAHDIDAVMELFTHDVDYWETPYQLVQNKDDLRQEWSAVLGQSNIDLDLRVFSSCDHDYSVIWKLSYMRENGAVRQCAGTYLITLDHEGRCTFFYQTSESQ